MYNDSKGGWLDKLEKPVHFCTGLPDCQKKISLEL